MAHVLIVDDEPDLAQLIDFNLRDSGFSTQLAGTGEAALVAAREKPPELVLLDLMLPDMSGIDVCRQLRAQSPSREVLIVMLTAKGEEADRIRGFEVGADDYVVKPFSVRELVLRLKAILRRGGTSQTTAETAPLALGALKLDLSAHRFYVEDKEVPLTALEFRLLGHLMTRTGRVQTREQLLEEVWGLSSSLETRTIDTHVMRLRDKLGPARTLLETVRGVGYRIVDPAH
ncbi:response regulator transcription factor [Myxococcus faecalis]|jgi:two-component system phosphate regulon response regulator PhoB|uniref:response regulator n=1 Tax=Myxococcus TaxID=32 RepID=UPI001CBD54A7|nr:MULTISPECIES: response regulator transcription factor [unclassified Myxococcus]MBZ4401891.1 response regulator transcription factor [Myxococcus sp. AS-1-15]MBZ4407302.1 response regulator transcription factor [Myxococcus sp. XM-1-1-1]